MIIYLNLKTILMYCTEIPELLPSLSQAFCNACSVDGAAFESSEVYVTLEFYRDGEIE